MTTPPKPAMRPARPEFSSGPCAKRPGWNPENLSNAVLGRSHRSKLGKARLKDAIDRTREVLGVPDDYLVGIVPGSDTGAVEMALWSMLGPKPVQLLAFDFTGSAPVAPNRAVDTLPLGPASIALWQEIERDTGVNLEIKITGGLMLAETERDIEILKGKIALEKSRGVEAELIGANELRQLEPCIGDAAIAAEWCPGEGKINPLEGTYAVVARARSLGARFRRGSNVVGIERDGTGWRIKTSRGDVLCKRVVNASGPWAAETARLAGVEIPVRAAPLQMIVTEPTAPTLTRLVAYTGRHLTVKQTGSGTFMIGGGWTAALDEKQKLSRALRPSVEGNLWIAARAVPALADLHAVRIWAGMNINIDRAPILGEVPGLPGFYNCVSSNGYTLAPVLARLTVEMMTGRSTSLPVAPYLLSRFG